VHVAARALNTASGLHRGCRVECGLEQVDARRSRQRDANGGDAKGGDEELRAIRARRLELLNDLVARRRCGLLRELGDAPFAAAGARLVRAEPAHELRLRLFVVCKDRYAHVGLGAAQRE